METRCSNCANCPRELALQTQLDNDYRRYTEIDDQRLRSIDRLRSVLSAARMYLRNYGYSGKLLGQIEDALEA